MNNSAKNTFSKTRSLNGPIKFDELVNDVPNRVHEELYNIAVNKLINDLDNYNLNGIHPAKGQSWNDIILSIKEISYSDYWYPSDVQITFKIYDKNGKPGFKRLIFDLHEYWLNCYEKDNTKSYSVKYDNNIENDIEIIKYDYIKGKATLRSKLEDSEYIIDFDELTKNYVESDSVNLANDTFTNLYKINV